MAITLIKNNTGKIELTAPPAIDYDGAYNKGYTEGANDGYELGHEEGFDEGYGEGYDYGFNEAYVYGVSDGWAEAYPTGQKDEQERFWEVFQNSGRRTEYRNAFYSWLWKDSIYNPIYTIVCKSNSNEMFRYNTSITDTKVDIDFSFANSQYVFAGATALKTIRKIITYENVNYTGWFSSCSSLESITFDGTIGQNIDFTACPLNKASLLNIIEHLKDYSGTSTTRTLSIGATNLSKLTTDEKKTAQDKGWTVL